MIDLLMPKETSRTSLMDCLNRLMVKDLTRVATCKKNNRRHGFILNGRVAPSEKVAVRSLF